MTQRAPGRKRSLVALTAFALMVLGAAAPSAFAQVSTSQVPGADAVTDKVTDAVSGATGGGSSTASGDTGGGATTGTVTDTVKETVDTTTDATDKATGGAVSNTGSTIKNTGGTIVEQTQKTVENTASDTGTAVNNTVNGVKDIGGGVTDPVLNPKKERDARGRDGNLSPAERDARGSNNKAAYRGELAGDRGSRKAADRTNAGSVAAADRKNMRNFSSTPASAVAPARESLISQIAEAAKQAAKTLAFPLGLALMVGAFLMVQGRIDRKDAKLVLAPIDAEQDLLSFQ